jgi:hypothetical protein
MVVPLKNYFFFRRPKWGIIHRYHHVRLVMNHYVFGPEYVIPVEALSVEYRNEYAYKCANIVISEVWKARIIDDELFMRGTHAFFHSEGNTVALFQSYLRYYSVCWHHRLGVQHHIPHLEPTQTLEDG